MNSVKEYWVYEMVPDLGNAFKQNNFAVLFLILMDISKF